MSQSSEQHLLSFIFSSYSPSCCQLSTWNKILKNYKKRRVKGNGLIHATHRDYFKMLKLMNMSWEIWWCALGGQGMSMAFEIAYRSSDTRGHDMPLIAGLRQMFCVTGQCEGNIISLTPPFFALCIIFLHRSHCFTIISPIQFAFLMPFSSVYNGTTAQIIYVIVMILW